MLTYPFVPQRVLSATTPLGDGGKGCDAHTWLKLSRSSSVIDGDGDDEDEYLHGRIGLVEVSLPLKECSAFAVEPQCRNVVARLHYR